MHLPTWKKTLVWPFISLLSVMWLCIGCDEAMMDAPDGDLAMADGATHGMSDAGVVSDFDSEVAAAGAFSAGLNENQLLIHDGVERVYNLVLPTDYDASRSYPVVFGFHGAFQLDRGPIAPQETFTNMGGREGVDSVQALVDEYEFVAISPAGGLSGDGNRTGWNSFPGHRISSSDDVGFVEALLDAVADEVLIDRERVFSTGHSSGAIFSYRLAINTSHFRAIAPSAGQLMRGLVELGETYTPVSLLHVHGTDDTTVPYTGGGRNPAEQFYSVNDVLGTMALANGCDETPETTLMSDGLEWVEYPNCEGDLRTAHLRVVGAGHHYGAFSENVTRAILDFFLVDE